MFMPKAKLLPPPLQIQLMTRSVQAESDTYFMGKKQPIKASDTVIKAALILTLILALPVKAQTIPAPITDSQTLQCLSTDLSETTFPAIFANCRDLIVPYVCSVWDSLPNGFTTTYPAYMNVWNSFCAAYKFSPPAPYKMLPP